MTIPRFDQTPPPGGYQWWYLDAFDPQSGHGLVIIAFIGSVFSPYYHRARQRAAKTGRADPRHYCALNVGLYRPRGKRWAMTERGESRIQRSATRFDIGPSHLEWRRDGSLEIRFDERSAPTGRRLAGRVVATPRITSSLCRTLDSDGLHTWSPWSPLADIEVVFERPAVRWSGEAYLDSNRGDEPLEAAFRQWDWSRTRRRNGVEIQYDVTRADGTESAIMLQFDETGEVQISDSPEKTTLRTSGWGIRRQARSAHPISLAKTLEDTPFYARSLLRVKHPDGPLHAVHESLDMIRFQRAWVRCLLPFRMPRRG